MTRDKLMKAINEAHRFLKAAQEAKQYEPNDATYLGPNKLTGAAKRASMDLTRALADLRRSN